MTRALPVLPDHVNPMQWENAVAIARQSCARIFRDGGQPVDAMVQFGAQFGARDQGEAQDWARAVEVIAEILCGQMCERRAA